MRKMTCTFSLLVYVITAIAQQYELKGKVIDEQTAKAMAGTTVRIKGSSTSVVTNNEGYYLFSKLQPGKIILIISFVGYETQEFPVNLTDPITTIPDISLTLAYKTGDEIVVSASKRPEKITDAPAAIQVISRKDIEQFTGSNVFELVSKVQGVEYTRTGVDNASINARGMNNAFNNKVFQLVDGRNSMNALSGSLPMHNNFSLVKDDIEKIEIASGPQTALYGPNAHNAIMNFITKDPRKSQGTTVSMSAGNQSQFSGRVRQATTINDKWAYKIAGEYAVGKEFGFYDTVYVTKYPPYDSSTKEDNINFNFRHIRGEGHIYYSMTPKADIIFSTGGSHNNTLITHTGGHLQYQDVTNSFIQARFVSSHFYGNIYNAWANFGTSYQIANYTRDFWNSTHGPIRVPPEIAKMNALNKNTVKETPQRLNAEAQYNTTFEKAGLFLVAGLSYQKDKPRAYGITLVDSSQRIYVTQYGAALQLEKKLPWNMRLVGAMRWDHHSNFGNFFSPKIGLVKPFGESNFRITWGRAYSMPTIIYQYAKNGNFYGNGEGITYVPNGSNLYDPASRKVTTPLEPEEVSTWEFGYKGAIAKKLYVDINYFNGHSKHFFGPSIGVGGRAESVGNIKVTHPSSSAGTVGADGTLTGARFVTVFNFGDVKVYGIDAGLTYNFNKFVSFAVRYSWLGSDISEGHADNDANKDDTVSADERSINSPANRVVVLLNFQNLCKQKIFINLSARYTSQYDFYSGNQISTAAGEGKRGFVQGPHGVPYLKNFDWGPLGGSAIIDISAGYKINSMMSVGMNITNLFDSGQREFAGSPTIGRLIMFELKMHVPNKKD